VKKTHQHNSVSGFTFTDIDMLVANTELFQESEIKIFTEIANAVNKALWENDTSKYTNVDELISIMCKIESNAFNNWLDAYTLCATGLYIKSSFFNHSCYQNIFKYELPSSTNHIYYALRDIKTGEALTYCYIIPGDDVVQRRKDLSNYYHFTCTCERCIDDENNGHTYDKFVADLCKNPKCRCAIFDIPEGMTLEGKGGKYCSICKFDTPNRTQ